jgi:lipopolysaccharide/colanic/teichoic acid biosynthesis glycosyltransferase
MVRRAVDLALAVPALVVLAPALLLVGLAIRRESRGPAIFRQTRVGREGVPFTMLKLRTMRTDDDASVGASVTAGVDDPRITRLGAVLRRAHLDELPQLVNVIRGEMTLIGPRPEVPAFVDLYSPEQRSVLAVAPGITGPGQLSYARRFEPVLVGASDPDAVYVSEVLGPKLEIELQYLRNRTLVTDLRILGRTLATLIGR